MLGVKKQREMVSGVKKWGQSPFRGLSPLHSPITVIVSAAYTPVAASGTAAEMIPELLQNVKNAGEGIADFLIDGGFSDPGPEERTQGQIAG